MPSKRLIVIVLVVLVFLTALWVFVENRPPANFPQNSEFAITKGEGLTSVANDLEAKGIIRSPFLLKVFVVLLGKVHGVISEDYLLKDPQSALSIAKRITRGDGGFVSMKVIIPEGSTVTQIGVLFGTEFFNFSQSEFSALATPRQGYLFPDTYLFEQTASASDVASVMEQNFQTKIAPIQPDITAFKKPLTDVVTMASILEGEANTPESRRIVAGILWKRIALGMPLQVDAAPVTYKKAGLPGSPINNPGLDAITDTVHPTKTNYLYYLTDKDGNFHYAVTYADHLKNKLKYLK